MSPIASSYGMVDPFITGRKPSTSLINILNRRQLLDNPEEKKLDINASTDYEMNRPLHGSVLCDRSGKATTILLKLGAHPDIRNRCYETPLHWACQHLAIANMRALLEHNASPNVHDIYKRTPLCSLFEQL